jgi:gamma-glutamyltranspeptidase/glutathione hydrolase
MRGLVVVTVASFLTPGAHPQEAAPRAPGVPVEPLAAGSVAAEPKVLSERALTTTRGAVAAVERRAAEIGARVLAEGGNAIDAAVATSFALAVTYPAAGNLGGGGFMLVALADGRTAAIDYRETAPRNVDEKLFLDARGRIDPLKTEMGHFVVGVPGTVAGLEEAHRRFGTKSWADLVRPARELAEAGFPIDAVLARGIAANAADFARFPASARIFLHPDGTPRLEGEPFVQHDLAHVLRWIEEGGARAFYEGPVAALLAAEMRRAGAPLDERDLALYRPVVRDVLATKYRGHELLLMPPPSSGGVALAQMLGILEPLELRKLGGASGASGAAAFGAEARHLFAEASRRAFAQRAQWLGDPDASKVPVGELLAPERLDELRATIDPEQATPSESLEPTLTTRESSSTTHFSVVDAAGNAVANTYTIEDWYGGRLVADGTGFLLNDELHDFNVKPGLTDREGHIGTAPNLVRPGRRPLSSMTPCIVRRDGQVELVTGSPGGRSIISTVTQVVLAVLELEQPLDAAIELPRQHHAWFPDELRVEPALDAATRARLEALGHRLVPPDDGFQGDAHSIQRDPATGRLRAVADRRIDGWTAAPAE